jgi:hypothetical protein
VENGLGVNQRHLLHLSGMLQRRAQDLLGTEMVFELASMTREFLFTLTATTTATGAEQPTESFYDTMHARHIQTSRVCSSAVCVGG